MDGGPVCLSRPKPFLSAHLALLESSHCGRFPVNSCSHYSWTGDGLCTPLSSSYAN